MFVATKKKKPPGGGFFSPDQNQLNDLAREE